MTKVRDAATITLRDGLAGVSLESPLEDIARAVHYAAKRLLRGGQPWTHDGRPGRRGELNVTDLVRDLFPTSSRDEYSALSGQVRGVLRRSGAAACLVQADPGAGRKPIWFVADEMPPAAEVAAAARATTGAGGGVSTYVATRRERALTPREAGEDRAPAPVTTGQVAPSALAVLEGQRERVAAEHALLREAVVQALSEYDEPLAATELAVLLPSPKPGANSTTTVRDCLRELEEVGRAFARLETRAERVARAGGVMPRGGLAMLWSTNPVVPPRVTGVLIPGAELQPAKVWAKKEAAKRRRRAHRRTRSAAPAATTPPPPPSPAEVAVAADGQQLKEALRALLGEDDRVRALEAENATLRRDNARLATAVASLKAAIAAMT